MSGYEAVGDALTNIGLSMIQREWAKRDRAEDLAAEQARSDREFALRQQELEASNLAKQEYLREKDRLDRERAEVEAIRKHGYDMEKVKAAGEAKIKAASVRGGSAREGKPSYDKIRNDITGEETYIERGGKMPEGFRFYQPRGDARRSGKTTPAKDYIGAAAGAASKLASTFASGTRAPLMASGAPRSPAPSAGRPVMAVDAPAKPSAPSAGPKPGDVLDGYQYIGGDPADQNSWKKL